MTLRDMIDQINFLIDDRLPDEWIVPWINDALAEVGAEVNATYPEVDKGNVYLNINTILPYKWQRLLLIVFAAGRAKEMDSSQFEYQDLYGQFAENLSKFKSKYVVPTKYHNLEPKQEIDLPDGSTHEAETGDTLFELANTYSTTVQDIINANDEIKMVTDYTEMDIMEQPSMPWFSSW